MNQSHVCKSNLSWGVVCLFILSAGSKIALAQASFQGLGDLPGGLIQSFAYGVSADGKVVVGRSRVALENEAFLWTEETGMVGLGDLPGGVFSSKAWGISADGSVVVGQSSSGDKDEAFRWTSGGGMVGLGDLPGSIFSSIAQGVSSDGSVVVGRSNGNEAFRWVDLNDNGLADPNEKLDLHPEFGLGDLPGGGFSSIAQGVSSDGSVVVGEGRSTLGQEAFRWTSENGMVGLGDLSGGVFQSSAQGVSTDGATVVGWSNSGNGVREAFRWTTEEGMVGLGDLPEGQFLSFAWGVSADGSVVVGQGNALSTTEAIIWDEVNGIRNLHDILSGEFNLDLTGWHLISASAVTPDGRTIVGIGINPSGDFDAWIATVPYPVTLNLNTFAAHWLETGCSDPDWCDGADINHDGTVNLLDFVLFANP